jgi:hypothetical protein
VRHLLFTLAVVVASTSVARGDEPGEDEDGAYVAFPKRSIGLFGIAHGTRIGGRSEGGFGPGLELALGKGRWQYFGEASIASSSMTEWTTSAADMRIDGKVAHGGLGVRWLARQFRPNSTGGVELILSSMLGVQRFYFEDAGRLTRPELGFGVGLQGRIYKKPRLAFRIEVRVVFTPNDKESALVACQGRCMQESGSSTGFTFGFGFAW